MKSLSLTAFLGLVLFPFGASAIEGQPLYGKSCTLCHGEDGTGDTGMGRRARTKGEPWPDLSKSKSTREDVLKVIKEGVPGTAMKAYTEKLSAEEIEALTNYVMTLRK